jgi:tetratricopeptide (TPR) repeat protein
MAYAQLGIVLLYQGRLDEAEPWLWRAERTLRTEVEPAAGMSLGYARAVLELARGRYQEALAAFRGAEKLAATLVRPHTRVTSMRSRMLQTLVRLGQAERVERALADLGERAVLFYAADDAAAGDLVAGLIRASGYEPVRVGGLDQSIRIEMFGDLHEYGALGRVVTKTEALKVI